MLKVIEAKNRKDIKEFIKCPLHLYRNDPFFAPQVTYDLLKEFSSKNPFFDHAFVRFFLAEKNNTIVGRIASIINKRHIEFHNEKAGFFGFFESINDLLVAQALLDRVSSELQNSKLEVMRGPMNFSANEECGFLYEGYDTPPMLMTPYNPLYYNELMHGAGLSKSKDLYGFILGAPEKLPDKIMRVASIAERRGIWARTVRKKKFSDDLEAFKEVYNSAWEQNWGFIPLTNSELMYLGKKLKPIAAPDMTILAFHNNSPVGFVGIVPDYNIALRKMNGSLNPLSIIRALIASKKIRQGRMLLLGIKKDYRNKGVDALLFREAFIGVRKRRYELVEFSWVLEDNFPVHHLVDMIGGKLYKKYRIYEKRI